MPAAVAGCKPLPAVQGMLMLLWKAASTLAAKHAKWCAGDCTWQSPRPQPALWLCPGQVKRKGGLAVTVCAWLHLATMSAEEVLPMPGGPLSSTAFLVMSLGLAPPALGASTFSPRRCTASLRAHHAPQGSGRMSVIVMAYHECRTCCQTGSLCRCTASLVQPHRARSLQEGGTPNKTICDAALHEYETASRGIS